MLRIALCLGLSLVLTPAPLVAQTRFDQPRTFIITDRCEAHASIRKKTEAVPLRIGGEYRAIGENKPTGASHAFIEVGGKRKWVALDCGHYRRKTGAVGERPATDSDCLPFFDDRHNPVSLSGSGSVDVTPPPPDTAPFGHAVNEVCGVPGKRVARGELQALLAAHPVVLERIRSFTKGRVFPDQSPPAGTGAYLEDLADAWSAARGYQHIFCGEPERGGSIGGLHFRGRYLELQEKGLACRLAGNSRNEEVAPGTIYSVGVRMEVNGGSAQQRVKGYGLTLSAEDIFKIATRAFSENPTRSRSSQGCLLEVEDEGERFTTVFVRRRTGIRTFFPDASPSTGRDPACAAVIPVPPVEESGRTRQ